MLHGLMVVNAFLRTTKFDDIYHTLLSAAHGEGMELDGSHQCRALLRDRHGRLCGGSV